MQQRHIISLVLLVICIAHENFTIGAAAPTAASAPIAATAQKHSRKALWTLVNLLPVSIAVRARADIVPVSGEAIRLGYCHLSGQTIQPNNEEVIVLPPISTKKIEENEGATLYDDFNRRATAISLYVWSGDYNPMYDVDNNYNPIGTSAENIKNLILDKVIRFRTSWISRPNPSKWCAITRTNDESNKIVLTEFYDKGFSYDPEEQRKFSQKYKIGL